jgi:hypothetical protein
MSTNETPSTNSGVVDESDVYGQQFLENDIRVEGDEIDARHAFLLTSDATGDRGRLMQVFQGIENAVEEFYGYNLRQWADESREGHEIPDGAQSHYVAWRRTEPANIIKGSVVDDPFLNSCFTCREFYTNDEGTGMSLSTELHAEWMDDMLLADADSEEEYFDRLERLDEFATGTLEDSVRAIEPPENPDTEAELNQSSAAYFWSHLVGTPVLKLELQPDGTYKPLEQVRYDWADENNKDKGVERVA